MSQWRAGTTGSAAAGAADKKVKSETNDRDTPLPEGPTTLISSLRFTPAGCANNMVGVTSWDSCVRVWGYETQPAQGGRLASAVRAIPLGKKDAAQPVLSLDFTLAGQVVFGGCDNAAHIWDIQADTVTQIAAHDGPVCCVRVCEAGGAFPMVVTAGWDGTVRFWDLRENTGAPAKEESFGHPVHDMDLRTAPVASFMCGRKIVLYDLANMAVIVEQTPDKAATYAMRRVCNIPNGTGVLAGTVDGRVNMFPTEPSRSVDKFKAHGGKIAGGIVESYQVNFVAVHPSCSTVYTGASDGLIRCLDIAQKGRFFECLPRMHKQRPVPIVAGDVSSDGQLLGYAAGYDWGRGKEGYDETAPQGCFLKTLTPDQVV